MTKTDDTRLDLGLTPADFGLLRFDPEEFTGISIDTSRTCAARASTRAATSSIAI